ncbi:MAG: hypothetical protein Q9163_003612 [Psora crenata]
MDGPLPPHFTNQQLHNPNHLFPSPHHPPSTLVSQHDLDPLDFQFDPTLENQPDLPELQGRNPFDPSQYDTRNQPRFHEVRSNAPVSDFQQVQHPGQGNQFGEIPRTPARQQLAQNRNEGQFGVLTLHPQLPSQPESHNEPFGQLQSEIDLRPRRSTEGGTDGHFVNMKMIPNPPKLDEWRKKLFDVDDTLTLTEDEFQTYFPHVDNVYSHRSTQRYKRKPFVSHYWDCRLKGRPPGTAKSDDPNKKKRKRTARERNLCDVKIKITEFFPGARTIGGIRGAAHSPVSSHPFAPAPSANGGQPSSSANILDSDHGSGPRHPGNDGSRYYTIQRVNGNGANGKGEVPAGGHKHTIEDSDKVKKNSIYRFFIKEERERRKSQLVVQHPFSNSGISKMSDQANPQQKTYYKKATGAALDTAKKHARDHELKLYGSCFCPFVQRVWVSLELKGLSYQYIEIDPYKKPDELLAINPRGLVPALKHGDWGCYESSILMEYLEDLNTGLPLLPQNDARSRAHCRLWADHINRKIVPQFYGLLQAQEPEKQVEHATQLKSELGKIIEATDPSGPFFLGPHISFVDVQFAPWIIRFRRVLTPYRDWPEPEPGSRWAAWVNAVENNEGVRSTTSTDQLYLDSYERYADNAGDFHMDYFIRFVQVHETFRRPEIHALATLADIDINFLVYSDESPYAIIRLRDDLAAQALISRSISSKAIYELWGSGTCYDELHADIVRRTGEHQWRLYRSCSFRFEFDTFQGSRAWSEQKRIMGAFSYVGFEGPIKMRDAQQTFTIFEEYDVGHSTPKRIFFARLVAPSQRHVLHRYSLKAREYINTTSMDSELALLTANITMAAPDRMFYDPFVGTGSFPVACSHFGAMTLGSDIDGRVVRGKGDKNIRTNFRQYGLLDKYLDGFISDLTHSPLRTGRFLDGVICDPPYGVREGLKVLGKKDGSGREVICIDGEPAHLQDKYIPPKRAYSLEAMLGDILQFAAVSLVDNGRVSVWMPTANDEEIVLRIPSHPALELVASCIQVFNKWSRRLLTYQRLPGVDVHYEPANHGRKDLLGASADDLNSFRKRYFEGFKAPDA